MTAGAARWLFAKEWTLCFGRSQESGIWESETGRRTILRRFAEDFMGKGPVSCMKCRPIRTFTAQNTGFSVRNRVWLKFTASEDKPHAPTAVFGPSFPRKRESRDFRD